MQFVPTIIVATEHLFPPEVGLPTAFRMPAPVPLNPGDPDAGEVTGFALAVACGPPESLQVRLVQQDRGRAHLLQRVEPPTDAIGSGAGLQPEVLSPEAQAMLRRGEGLYWIEPSPTASPIEYRVSIMLPDALRTPFLRVEVFASVAPDGTPIGADSVALAEDFFYMVVLGDSVMWGNGLPEEDKFSTRVAAAIETHTGKRVIRQVLAVSGAGLVPDENEGVCGIDCFRSAPDVTTSLPLQLDHVEHPELTDLVLVDGCVNDVGVTTILDTETTPEALSELTVRFCRDEMADLLRRIRALMPQAPVVVTGYYPIVSAASDLEDLLQWLTTQEVTVQENLDELVEKVAANSELFDATARSSLAEAVAQVNAESRTPMIAFADPGISPEHSIFTSDSWLWGLRASRGSALGEDFQFDWVPEDPMLSRRVTTCLEQLGTGPTIPCLYSSLGHPNREGAQAYADAILAALRTLGVLDAGS